MIESVLSSSKYLIGSLLPGGELLFIHSIVLATIPSRPNVPHTDVQCVYEINMIASFGPLHCLRMDSVACDKPALSVTTYRLWYPWTP